MSGDPKVNFVIDNCTHTIIIDDEIKSLSFCTELSLKKTAEVVSKDEWSTNEWNAEVPIQNFRVTNHSPNVVCGLPVIRTISRGRKAFDVSLSAPGNSRLAIGDFIEFTLEYTKSVSKGTNYEQFEILPFIPVYILQMDPVQMFNQCEYLRYRIMDHKTLGILGAVPSKDSERDHAFVFCKENLKPDETYSLALVLIHKGLGTRLVKRVLKLLWWIIANAR